VAASEVCTAFRETGRCRDGEHSPRKHPSSEKKCSDSRYLKSGFCSKWYMCPDQHPWNKEAHGDKREALEKYKAGRKKAREEGADRERKKGTFMVSEWEERGNPEEDPSTVPANIASWLLKREQRNEARRKASKHYARKALHRALEAWRSHPATAAKTTESEATHYKLAMRRSSEMSSRRAHVRFKWESANQMRAATERAYLARRMREWSAIAESQRGRALSVELQVKRAQRIRALRQRFELWITSVIESFREREEAHESCVCFAVDPDIRGCRSSARPMLTHLLQR